MSSKVTLPVLERRRTRFAGDEILLDYRERRALEALERAELKRKAHAEQSSAANSADARIRAWEKLHQLRMPSAPQHPILEVIAASTQLTLAGVTHEQQMRCARPVSTVI